MNRLLLKSILRNLIREKSTTLINILGLTTAMAVVLFLLNYIFYEKSFDTFYPEADHIYRIESKIVTNGEVTYHGAKSPQGIYFFVDQVNEIEAITSLFYEACQVKYKNLNFPEQDVVWAADGMAQVLAPNMQIGTIDMKRPHTGIVSSSKAKALFGNENPVGKMIKVNKGFPIEITGVFNDMPSNTHLKADYFFSMPTWLDNEWVNQEWFLSWDGNTMWNYIKTKPQHIETVRQRLNEQVLQERPTLAKQNISVEFDLRKIEDIHFETGLKGDFGPKSKMKSIHNLILFGFFVLMIAVIRFIILKTAQNLKTSGSLGIHKLIDAGILNVVKLLNQNIAIWLLISITLAVSLSIYLTKKWLDNFAYKTDIEAWVFIVSGILMVFIVSFTVSFQTIKAAVRNPAEALRYE